MGKRSKKKGGKTTKAARREKLQGRREQHLEELDRDNEPSSDRQYFEGDRVWFDEKISWGDGTNPNNYRGIVKSVADDGSLEIIPFQSMIDGSDVSVKLSAEASREHVFPDFCNLTLRFDVGDNVLCLGDGGWVPQTVSHLWPIAEIREQGLGFPSIRRPTDMVPQYKCNGSGQILAAPEDDDNCIREHQSSFRLMVGERVLINTLEARTDAPKSLLETAWIEGNVVERDIMGFRDYGAYACKFVLGGKDYSCHITEDNDEHIARFSESPRCRLLESISQRCTRNHLEYLTATHKIDVTTFRDLATMDAIQAGSYTALAWLQNDCNIDILNIKDDAGNMLLHMIASSSNAVHFFERAGEVSWENAPEGRKLNLTGHEKLINSINKNGESWLQILVARDDIRALDVALSPRTGFGWELSSAYVFDEKIIASLQASINDCGNAIMKIILDSFLSLRTKHSQCQGVQCLNHDEKTLFARDYMKPLQGANATLQANLLAQFYMDWKGNSPSYLFANNKAPFSELVTNGLHGLFCLLYEANKNMFLNESYGLGPKEDKGEYQQPELTIDIDLCDHIRVDLFSALIIGSGGSYHKYTRKHLTDRNFYIDMLQKHTLLCDSNSWLCQMKALHKELKEGYEYDRTGLFETKINLLEDEKNLEGRIKILGFLLEKLPSTKLDFVLAIRHRQCGVLRFMVDKGLLDLDKAASQNTQLAKHTASFQFLENGRIPSAMKMRCFLCFVAAQYDDFQTLEWLCQSSGVPMELSGGMNLLHFSSFMGRIEIVAWLFSQPVWQTLSLQLCRRRPFQNAFAVHIAASEGHIALADMLLAVRIDETERKNGLGLVRFLNLLSVTAPDKKGRHPEFYAKKSSHPFVVEWAKSREKPADLDRNIRRLLKIASGESVEDLKKHITDTKCFDIETWKECDYCSYDEVCPMGYSFQDILRDCCSKCPDQAFVLWICEQVYFTREDFNRYRMLQRVRGGIKGLSSNDLIKFAIGSGYGDIEEYLSTQYFKNITCKDPFTEFQLLMTVSNDPKIFANVHAKILRAVILSEIARVSDSSIRSLLSKGGGIRQLGELHKINREVNKTLVDEGYARWFKNLSPLDMASYLYSVSYEDGHRLCKQISVTFRAPIDLRRVHIVLATEGFYDLLLFCLKNFEGWTVEIEVEVCRIAAFFGHARILDRFLGHDDAFLSDASNRYQAAMLGAGESCRHRDLLYLSSKCDPPIETIHSTEDLEVASADADWDQKYVIKQSLLAKSLLCSVLNGYAKQTFDAGIDNDKELRTLKALADKFNYSHDKILLGFELMFELYYGVEIIIKLLQTAVNMLCVQPVLHHDRMQSLCKKVVSYFDSFQYTEKSEDGQKQVEILCLDWVSKIVEFGIDIQNLAPTHHIAYGDEKSFYIEFRKLAEHQLHSWAKLDIIKNGGSIEQVEFAMDQGDLTLNARDRGGLLLSHLSSAYNRADLLEWLVHV